MAQTPRAAGGKGESSLRRLIAVALLGLACAQPGMPPGGPPDVAAPQIVRITPDSGAVGVRPKEVVFKFDEVVAERPPSTTSLSDLFLISPRNGVPSASWHRDAVSVRPTRGWRANTPYTVILLRGLADIRGNVRNVGATTFFSTGSTIPRTRISGTVFDWVGGRPASGALVEALIPPDTINPYVALADSSGRFAIEHLPPARYKLRAFVDRNRNLAIDPSEAWDSASVTLADTASAVLLLFVHDTLPPRIREVRSIDSTTLRVTFDRPLDPTQSLAPANFVVTGPDSVPIPIERVGPPTPDTIPTPPSVSPTRPPTAAAAAPVPAPARASPTRARPPTVVPRGQAGAQRADTTERPPVMPKPSPLTEVEIRLRRALAQKTPYRVRAIGIRGLLGRTAESERAYTLPAPPPAPAGSSAPPRSSPPSGNPPPQPAPPNNPAAPPPGP